MTMPRFHLIAPALLVTGLLASGPVLGSPCGDRIAALEGRIDRATANAVASSSGGQGVAAARQGQADQAAGGAAPATPPVPFQETGREADATRRAAEAGGGGEVVQARAALNRARALDTGADAASCLDSVAEAERLLAAPR
jgi:hypothetical protein